MIIDAILRHREQIGPAEIPSRLINGRSPVAIFTDSAFDCVRRIAAAIDMQRGVVLMPDGQTATVESMIDAGCSVWTDDASDVSERAEHQFQRTDGVYFATSGSTGDAKFIFKSFSQLEAEVECLIESLPDPIGCVGGTASHQHIYGFLFRVLIPLVKNRPFAEYRWSYPEQIEGAVKMRSDWLVIATPAHLQRLGNLSLREGEVALVVSSGAPLMKNTALEAKAKFQSDVLEVFGSTETGGIALRSQSAGEHSWRLLAPVVYHSDTNSIESPWCGRQVLSDQLSFQKDGSFSLGPRTDRIAKVGGKRVSLAKIETVLESQANVDRARVFAIDDSRIGALVKITSDDDISSYVEQARNVTTRLKTSLLNDFEATVTPKVWRVVTEMPSDARGKLSTKLWRPLLSLDNRCPKILSLRFIDDHCLEMTLGFSPRLPWFQGHFPSQPIFPGVATSWVVDYVIRSFFNETAPLASWDAAKFSSSISPNDLAVLTINYHPAKRQYAYKLVRDEDTCASGKFKYE
jgi:acyl-coenzyme A synthetase/AMP-(fatty) acid ligase/3-hydroxymyristoyl/3-hydroxydecanoyl-(acyl carrier protein) dehydratase